MKELVLPSVNRPFVEALHHVADTAGTWSVIGGFAVWCHLGESHRPTLDIDTAAASEAHETLVALGAPGDSAHRRIVEGVKLEIIEVLDPGPDASDLDDKNRLFVTAHWAAARLTFESLTAHARKRVETPGHRPGVSSFVVPARPGGRTEPGGYGRHSDQGGQRHGQ